MFGWAMSGVNSMINTNYQNPPDPNGRSLAVKIMIQIDAGFIKL